MAAVTRSPPSTAISRHRAASGPADSHRPNRGRGGGWGGGWPPARPDPPVVRSLGQDLLAASDPLGHRRRALDQVRAEVAGDDRLLATVAGAAGVPQRTGGRGRIPGRLPLLPRGTTPHP